MMSIMASKMCTGLILFTGHHKCWAIKVRAMEQVKLLWCPKHYASVHQNGKAQLLNALGFVQEEQQVSSLEAETDEAGTLTLRHIPTKCHIHKCRWETCWPFLTEARARKESMTAPHSNLFNSIQKAGLPMSRTIGCLRGSAALPTD